VAVPAPAGLVAPGGGFAIYFIVPKIEASWAARGMRPPGWATMLISGSHFVIKYWYTILIALVIFIWFRRPTSGRPRE
jgi:type II secretory pathway component PulF